MFDQFLQAKYSVWDSTIDQETIFLDPISGQDSVNQQKVNSIIKKKKLMNKLVSINLNGQNCIEGIPDNMLLVDFLREKMGLTGTKIGCDGGECGCCEEE